MTCVPKKQPRDVQEEIGAHKQMKLFVKNFGVFVERHACIVTGHAHQDQIEEKPESLKRVDNGPCGKRPTIGRDVNGDRLRDRVGRVVEQAFDRNGRGDVEKDHGRKGKYVGDEQEPVK